MAHLYKLIYSNLPAAVNYIRRKMTCVSIGVLYVSIYIFAYKKGYKKNDMVYVL